MDANTDEGMHQSLEPRRQQLDKQGYVTQE
jgi:hypothetical protein